MMGEEGHLLVLAINPGSTSTKTALYSREGELFSRSVAHDPQTLARRGGLAGQLAFRKAAVLAALREADAFSLDRLSAVIGRGGLLKPLPGGVYRVNERMKQDLAAERYGSHASNLGALIADQIAREAGVPAFIADPVVVDELGPLARYTGLPEIARHSIFHALNQKATARRAARQLGRPYEECRLIVAHLGGGTSIGIHDRGRVVDVNNALDGDGPFSIERAGALPAGDWMRFVLRHAEDPAGLQRRLTGQGGVVAWLGTNDARRIEEAIRRAEAGAADAASAPPGDVSAGGQSAAGGPHRQAAQSAARLHEAPGGLDGRRCREVMQALAYQIAKQICALAAVVCGRVDAVVLTGGLAHNERVVREVRERVGFLAPVLLFPGENELEALSVAAMDALEGRQEVLEYTG